MPGNTPISNPNGRQSDIKVILAHFEDEEWGKRSNREIARRCAVHHQMVGKLRDELSLDESSSEKPEPRTYTTKHGTTPSAVSAGSWGIQQLPEYLVNTPDEGD